MFPFILVDAFKYEDGDSNGHNYQGKCGVCRTVCIGDEVYFNVLDAKVVDLTEVLYIEYSDNYYFFFFSWKTACIVIKMFCLYPQIVYLQCHKRNQVLW